MDSQSLNRWLSLGANVGVIAGLILVAIQINQNTAITRALVTNDYYLADMQLELAMMGEDPARSFTKAVYAPETIDEYDAAVLDRYFNYGMVQIHRLEEMNRQGLAPEDWEDSVEYLGWHLGNSIGLRWWQRYREEYPDDFRRRVDAVLEEHDRNRLMLDAMLSADSADPE